MRILHWLLLCCVAAGCDGGPFDPSGGCRRSICGCPELKQVTGTGRVTARDGGPAAGIVVACSADVGDLATTDTLGAFSFSTTVTGSAGCGFGLCNTLELKDPTGQFETRKLEFTALPDAGPLMLTRPDGG